MSLVNDMLKDLDQRRKSSEGSGSPVNLTPVSDTPKSSRSKFLIVAFLCLLVAVSAVGYVFFQQGGFEGQGLDRQLNIQPEYVSTPVEQTQPINNQLASEQPAASTEAPIQQTSSDAETVAQASPAVESVADITLAANTANATRAPAEVPATSVEIAEAGNAAVSSEQTALASGETVEVSSTSGDAVAAAAEELIPQSETETSEPIDESANVTNAASVANTAGVESGEAATELATTGEASEAETVAVVNLPPQESVKDYAQMSPEQQDTLAVQYALRLIAETRDPEAYASLEQHIMQNRYAHQSRETYAKLLLNDGQLLAATNLLRSGLDLAPNHPGFKKVMARILLVSGEPEEAAEMLSRRAPPISEDIEYHELLAGAQFASRDYEGSLISYTSLVQQDRNQGKFWYGFAASQDGLGNRQNARQGYNQAIQHDLSPNIRRRIQERLTVLNQ